MQGTNTQRPVGFPAAFIGLLLVIVGVGVFAARQLGVDLAEWLGESGWPAFVIVPGLVLLAIAFVPAPPAGVGFAIAGSIVTTVGLILLFQANTGEWQSWAYAWALLPGAAGLAMAVYGSITSNPSLVRPGTRILAIFGTVFVIGLALFESLFDTGRTPFGIGELWPLLVIGAGVVIFVGAMASPPRGESDEGATSSGGDERWA